LSILADGEGSELSNYRLLFNSRLIDRQI